jgi:hypothetical protein
MLDGAAELYQKKAKVLVARDWKKITEIYVEKQKSCDIFRENL